MTASLKLPIFNLCYAACSLAIGVAGVELTSHEEHQLRRIAMQDAFQQHHQNQPHSSSSSDDEDVDDDVNKSSVFFSTVQEQRSYYYFHAGVEMAWKHVQLMSSPAPAPGDEEDDEVTDENNTDLQQLEDALEVELARVRQQLALLQKADDTDTDVVIAGETEEATKSDSEEEVPPEQRIQHIFKEQYLQFECTHESHDVVSYEDAQKKWSELRHRYLNFVNIMSEEMGDDNNPFIANPQLYVNFTTITDTSINTDNDNSESINSTNTTTTTNNTQSTFTTKRLGLFASQDFAQGDTVYSQKTPNRVYFSSPTQWINFLHSLPSSNTTYSSRGNDDACQALEWSFMKQISRPGRWMLGLVLDESVFMARVEEVGEGDEYYYEEDESEQQGDEEGDDDTKNWISNVALDDERSFEYVALRDIKMGDEIVERALPVEGKREWYL